MNKRAIFAAAILLSRCFLSSGQAEERRDTISQSKITAERMTTPLSVVAFDLPEIGRMVSPTGEGDVIKFLQTLAGVSQGTEGGSAYFVRGGNQGNNLIEMDGVRIYGTSHLLGFSTSIPQGILSSARFHLGGINGEHSNLLSSVLELQTRSTADKTEASVSLSNFFASADVVTPIVKDRLTLVASARVSPFGKEYNLLSGSRLFNFNSLLPTSMDATIYDVFTKLSWKPGDNTRISLSYFKTADSYKPAYTPSKWDRIGWGNDIINLQAQTTLFGDWDFSGNVAFNRFSNSFEQHRFSGFDAVNHFGIQSSLKEAGLNGKLVYNGESTLRHSIGYRAGVTHFNTAGTSSGCFMGNLWYQAGYGIEGIYSTQAMLRANIFASDKAAGGSVFFNPEASFTATYHLTRELGLALTGDYLTQYYHLAEGLPTGWSMDVILPACLANKPETALQIAAGGFFKNEHHDLKIGAYSKWYYNLVFCADPAAFFRKSADVYWQSQLYSGKGSSVGIETSYSYDGDRLDMNLAYTLSRTDRRFPGLCHGNPFPAKFDRPHILNLNLDYSLGNVDGTDYGITAFFTAQSGYLETARTGYVNTVLPGGGTELLEYWGSYNNYRMPAYIRLDLGYYGRWKTRHTLQCLNFGVFNVFNRHNPSFIFAGLYSNQTWEKISLLPIMPSLSYKVSWR